MNTSSTSRFDGLKWRTHEEGPGTKEPVTALLMIPDHEGSGWPHIIAGVYLWRGGQWLSEDTLKPCSKPFWWVLEDEIAATVVAPRSESRDTITIPLETARLVRKACLPINPNKCRGWHPDMLAAAREFIAAVESREFASGGSAKEHPR